MSAIMGSLLVILGAFGFSVSLCLEYRMRLVLLKQIRGVYEYMEFQISYGKLPIPEILRKLSFKDELCFRQEFGRIAQRMEEGGQELAVIWKEELGPSLRKSGLKKKEQVTWKMQPPERNISLKVQKVSKSIKKYICLIPVKKTTCLFSNPCLKKLKRSTFSARLIMKGIHTIFP